MTMKDHSGKWLPCHHRLRGDLGDCQESCITPVQGMGPMLWPQTGCRMKGLLVKMYQTPGNGIWIIKKRNSAGLSISLF